MVFTRKTSGFSMVTLIYRRVTQLIKLSAIQLPCSPPSRGTLPRTNSLPPANRPGPKRKCHLPTIFRCDLSVSGRRKVSHVCGLEFVMYNRRNTHYVYPIGSMYGIFTYIYHKNQPNVGKYTIDGSCGYRIPSYNNEWTPHLYLCHGNPREHGPMPRFPSRNSRPH